jgi:hypothetical protein
MNSRTSIAALGLVAVALAGTTLADPVPPWENPRQDRSHYWAFDFNYEDSPLAFSSEGGDPHWQLTKDAEIIDIGVWWEVRDGRLGIFTPNFPDLEILLLVPNERVYDQTKWFFFEFEVSDPGYVSVQDAYTTDPYSQRLGDVHVETKLNPVRLSGYVRFHPQPDHELLSLKLRSPMPGGGDVWIDDLRVGSVCIPEPASLALLALGSLVTLRQRRVQRV